MYFHIQDIRKRTNFNPIITTQSTSVLTILTLSDMIDHIYFTLLRIMPILAVVVFIALFFIKAGYGMFQTKQWGFTVNNKLGWVLMESPAFLLMLYLWCASTQTISSVPFIFFLLFEVHYFQRSFVFPFLMSGKSRMPVSIMLMGITFNLINAFLLGESLFYHIPEGWYTTEWLIAPHFIIGFIIFIVGMVINLHSDHVIRHLRQPGDTRHYLPNKGMYSYVTSGNYFGELTEWTGFAIMTSSLAAWIFVIWTFANLAPRAHSIRKKYCQEFGAEAVGKRKCLIPFIY